MANVLEVQTTFATEEEAIKVGRLLVAERLAACAQIMPHITSIYEWESMLRHDKESMLLLKTTTGTWPELRDRLAELHPYEMPQIIALPVEYGSFDYLTWVKENTKL